MPEHPHSLTPTIEFSLIGLGALAAAAAHFTRTEIVFTASVMVCAVAGLAAVFSTALRSRGRTAQSVAAVVGFGAALFGAYWLIAHSGEPEIFSPGLLAYPGGGLLLSSIIALTDSQRRNRHRNKNFRS